MNQNKSPGFGVNIPRFNMYSPSDGTSLSPLIHITAYICEYIFVGRSQGSELLSMRDVGVIRHRARDTHNYVKVRVSEGIFMRDKLLAAYAPASRIQTQIFSS